MRNTCTANQHQDIAGHRNKTAERFMRHREGPEFLKSDEHNELMSKFFGKQQIINEQQETITELQTEGRVQQKPSRVQRKDDGRDAKRARLSKRTRSSQGICSVKRIYAWNWTLRKTASPGRCGAGEATAHLHQSPPSSGGGDRQSLQEGAHEER